MENKDIIVLDEGTGEEIITAVSCCTTAMGPFRSR